MARARKKGDEATNARKRYYRDAQRRLKRARETKSPVIAMRERTLAEESFRKAFATYEPGQTQKMSKPMQDLAKEFGVNTEQMREKQRKTIESNQGEISEFMQRKRESVIEASKKARVKDMSQNDRRMSEAEIIFSSEIGHRIIGGTASIWRDAATEEYTDENGIKRMKVDRSKIFPALFEHYGVDNLADLLDAIEDETGEDLYSEGAYEQYAIVRNTIASHVKQSKSYM